MTTDTSDKVQNQSSRQAMMASIRTKSFIESTDLSSDMLLDSAVVIGDTLMEMAQVLNRVTDKKPSVTHGNNKDNFLRLHSMRIAIL